MTSRTTVLFGIICIGIAGTVAIIVCAIFVSTSLESVTATSLITFLGAILSFLYAAYHLTGNQESVNTKVDSVASQATDIQTTVNGERKRMQTVIMAAIADHPDVAAKAEEVGLTLPTTDAKAS